MSNTTGSDTGSYKLTPTGPHKVVSAADREAGLPAGHEQSKRLPADRCIFVVCPSAELAQNADIVAQSTPRQEKIRCENENDKVIELFIQGLKTGSKPKLMLLDETIGPIPVSEFIPVIRSIETGMGETRTPILVLGDAQNEAELTARISQYGNTRFVRRSSDGDVQAQAQRVIHLVDKILSRGK